MVSGGSALKKASGRGTLLRPKPLYSGTYVVQPADLVGIDDSLLADSPLTQSHAVRAKGVVNSVQWRRGSKGYSMNPYQGCEHGCVYCYARHSHNYWSEDPGLGFETHIQVKHDIASLLERKLQEPSWQVAPIVLSGNTDCYQPLERKYGLTRAILAVCAHYGQPVSIITKNALVLRDIDQLQTLAQENLVHVYMSLTTANEPLRRLMEPRTATYAKKLNTIATLRKAGVPVGIMCAPIIPGLNDHEIPQLLQDTAAHGALNVHYTFLRLDPSNAEIIRTWLQENLPERAKKVWEAVTAQYDTMPNKAQPRGRKKAKWCDGIYETVRQLFVISKQKYFKDRQMPPLNLAAFRRHQKRLF